MLSSAITHKLLFMANDDKNLTIQNYNKFRLCLKGAKETKPFKLQSVEEKRRRRRISIAKQLQCNAHLHTYVYQNVRMYVCTICMQQSAVEIFPQLFQ